MFIYRCKTQDKKRILLKNYQLKGCYCFWTGTRLKQWPAKRKSSVLFYVQILQNSVGFPGKIKTVLRTTKVLVSLVYIFYIKTCPSQQSVKASCSSYDLTNFYKSFPVNISSKNMIFFIKWYVIKYHTKSEHYKLTFNANTDEKVSLLLILAEPDKIELCQCIISF